jgi:hypothetical protein
MPGKYRIVFNLPGKGDEKFYFRRDSEVTPDIVQAHNFHSPDSAIAFRDRFRDEYKQCRVFIVDALGNTLFERAAPPPNETEDTRQAVWFCPDDLESQRLGFVVRPCIRPDLGRCWCIRASDFPNLVGRDIESVFGMTPLEAVERCRALWGPSLAQPIPSPLADQQETEEARRILNEIKHGLFTGPQRPGNRS